MIHETGQIAQDAYDQATVMQQIADALNEGSITAGQVAAAVQLLLGKLKQLDGMTVTAYINIVGGDVDPIAQAVNEANKIAGEATGQELAEVKHSGGQLSQGWNLVGDAPGGQLTPYSELISPSGYVFNAEQTRRIVMSGRIKPASRAIGGDLYDTTPTSPIKKSPLPQLPKTLSGTKINPSTGEAVIEQMVSIAQAAIENVSAPVMNGVSQQMASTTQLQILKTTESIRETKKTNDLQAQYACICQVCRVSEKGKRNDRDLRVPDLHQESRGRKAFVRGLR